MREQLVLPALILSGIAIILFLGLRQRKSQRIQMGYKPVEDFRARQGGCELWLLFGIFLGYLIWVIFRGFFQ